MYKETCKTTKFIDFKIQKYSLSMTIQQHSDTLSLFLSLMGNTNVCCPIQSHWTNPIPMDKPANRVSETS